MSHCCTRISVGRCPTGSPLFTFGFPPIPPPKVKMTSSASPSSVITSQTTSIAQANVSTNASTLASVFVEEESLEIFALDQIHDYYHNGYSQDEADMVTLFLGQCVLWHFPRLIPDLTSEGVSAVVYLVGYIASLLILRHRRNKRKVSIRYSQ